MSDGICSIVARLVTALLLVVGTTNTHVVVLSSYFFVSHVLHTCHSTCVFLESLKRYTSNNACKSDVTSMIAFVPCQIIVGIQHGIFQANKEVQQL